ncbi:unnamed protein product [Ixodes hexagonus]
MKIKKDTSCFAPQYKTDYKSVRQGPKVSFSMPKNRDRFRQWGLALRRGDKELQPHSAVCERHFEDKFIVRKFTHVINGEVVGLARGRPCLTEDPVPSILPNAPSYLTKRLPAKRKSRNSTGDLPSKYAKAVDTSHDAGMSLPQCSSFESGSALEETSASTSSEIESTLVAILERCNLPSVFWIVHSVPDSDTTVVFSACFRDGQSIALPKVVVFEVCRFTIHATVSIQGTVVQQTTLHTGAEANSILEKADMLVPCKGIEVEQRYRLLLNKMTQKTHGSSHFSSKCAGVVQSKLKSCVQCRYGRKLLLNQLSYQSRKLNLSNTAKCSYKMKLKAARLK